MNSARVRVAKEALSLFPDMLKIKCADDLKFRHSYDLSIRAFMEIGLPDGEFPLDEFYRIVRACYKKREVHTLRSTSGKVWRIGLEQVGSDTRFVLRCDKFVRVLTDIYSMDGNRSRRILRFKQEAAAVNLPQDACARWTRLLSRRAIHDDEQTQMEDDFYLTPARMISRIREGLRGGGLKIEQAIPDQEVFYERLVGRDAVSDNIADYGKGEIARHVSQWIDWDATRGGQMALLLAGQGAIMAALTEESIDRLDLEGLLSWAHQYGDPISRLGAFELGLRRLVAQPHLAEPLVRLLKSLLAEDPEAPGGPLGVMSACFMLVEGELSRSRALKSWRPFRHRLASLTHAALMTQQLMGLSNNEKFIEWAKEMRSYPFYCKSLIDLRLEPRWIPDLASAEQFHAEIMGRLLLCAQTIGIDAVNGELKALLFESGTGGLLDKVTLMSFWAGPLEGTWKSQAELPPDIAQLITANLTSEAVTAMSFVSLVNSRSPFAVAPYIDLAIASIKRANYRLNSEDTTTLAAALFGLAAVAASERRPDLASELRIVARQNRHCGNHQISVLQEHRVALIAAAAHADVEQWGRFFGDWSLELSHLPLANEQARDLLDEIIMICRICPDLSHFLARSRAALSSLAEPSHLA